MIFVGIDPGLKGAIAFMNGERTAVLDMPIRGVVGASKVRDEVDPLVLKAIIRRYVGADEAAIAAFEDLNVFVGGGPNSKIKKSPVTSAYQEANKQVVRTVLELCGIPMDNIRPMKWQSFYGIAKNDTEDTKKQSLRIARDMFGREFCPLEKHDGRADALLLAHYAKRHFA